MSPEFNTVFQINAIIFMWVEFAGFLLYPNKMFCVICESDRF